MRIRFKFAKTGLLRYVGHLDFLRYVQKMIARSGIPAVYSGGFSPHMLLSFAVPLGVGQETAGDYFDLETAWRDPYPPESGVGYLTELGYDETALPAPPASQEICRMLNEVSVEDVRILSARRISSARKDHGMASVHAAGYLAVPLDSFFTLSQTGPADLTEKWKSFLAQDVMETQVARKVKTRRKTDGPPRTELVTKDIRPFLFTGPEEAACEDEACGELRFTCACGSESNLKPETVLSLFVKTLGLEFRPYDFSVTRLSLLDAAGRSLEELGRDF